MRYSRAAGLGKKIGAAAARKTIGKKEMNAADD
jgi:hypothetical protein